MHSQYRSSQTSLGPQDLSGTQIKVVQYCIVSVVPGIADNARVLLGPQVVAFGDEMTSEDFTAWIIAENAPPKPREEQPCFPPNNVAKCWDRKYLRVAFTVMGRFSRAEIDWKELQAVSVARIADRIDPTTSCDSPTSEQVSQAAAAAAASADNSEP